MRRSLLLAGVILAAALCAAAPYTTLSRTGWTIACDSETYGPAIGALDGASSTGWISGSGSSHYCVIDMQAPRTFSFVAWAPVQSNAFDTSATVQVSDDNSTWTNFGSTLTSSDWISTRSVSAALQTHRYIKITFTPASGTFASADEIIVGTGTYWNATASSTAGWGYLPFYLTDQTVSLYGNVQANGPGRWASDNGFPQWAAINIGSGTTYDTITWRSYPSSGSGTNDFTPTHVNIYLAASCTPWSSTSWGTAVKSQDFIITTLAPTNYTIQLGVPHTEPCIKFEVTSVYGTGSSTQLDEIGVAVASAAHRSWVTE